MLNLSEVEIHPLDPNEMTHLAHRGKPIDHEVEPVPLVVLDLGFLGYTVVVPIIKALAQRNILSYLSTAEMPLPEFGSYVQSQFRFPSPASLHYGCTLFPGREFLFTKTRQNEVGMGNEMYLPHLDPLDRQIRRFTTRLILEDYGKTNNPPIAVSI